MIVSEKHSKEKRMENQISNAKIKLLEKIISAKLSSTEIQELTAFTQTVLDKRPQPVDTPSAV
jgi:hypothetical protein